MPDWPGRYFLDGVEIDETAAYAAEANGAKVSRASSGDVPEALGGGNGPWLELAYPTLPCHVVSYSGEGVIHIASRERGMPSLVALTPDQAEEVAGYLMNHARNVRGNLPVECLYVGCACSLRHGKDN